MDALFNLYKIRFTKLDELLCNNNDMTEESTVNIYFNLESIWKLMINHNNEKYLKNKGSIRIIETTANIVNLAAHYRLWCKKHNLRSRVILYTPSFKRIRYSNSVFNNKYRGNTLFKYNENSNYLICQDTIRESIEMAKTILQYVEGIYLIEGYDIEPSIIPLICKHEFGENDTNFIITTDDYDFQYSNYDFYVFRPKKDESFLIRKGELINKMKESAGIKNKLNVSDDLFSFILAILGNGTRNIEKIKGTGVSTILTLIHKAMSEKLITDSTRNIELLIKSLKPDVRGDVLNNFYCTDISFQYSILQTTSRLAIEHQIKDKFDIESLEKLNNNYFMEAPIQLFELLPDKRINKPEKKKLQKRNSF